MGKLGTLYLISFNKLKRENDKFDNFSYKLVQILSPHVVVILILNKLPPVLFKCNQLFIDSLTVKY